MKEAESEKIPDLDPASLIELREQLTEALSGLNAFDRNLLYLYGREELSTKELSEVTGLSESAVKVKIHRLLKGIKEARK